MAENRYRCPILWIVHLVCHSTAVIDRHFYCALLNIWHLLKPTHNG